MGSAFGLRRVAIAALLFAQSITFADPRHTAGGTTPSGPLPANQPQACLPTKSRLVSTTAGLQMQSAQFPSDWGDFRGRAVDANFRGTRPTLVFLGGQEQKDRLKKTLEDFGKANGIAQIAGRGIDNLKRAAAGDLMALPNLFRDSARSLGDDGKQAFAGVNLAIGIDIEPQVKEAYQKGWEIARGIKDQKIAEGVAQFAAQHPRLDSWSNGQRPNGRPLRLAPVRRAIGQKVNDGRDQRIAQAEAQFAQEAPAKVEAGVEAEIAKRVASSGTDLETAVGRAVPPDRFRFFPLRGTQTASLFDRVFQAPYSEGGVHAALISPSGEVLHTYSDGSVDGDRIARDLAAWNLAKKSGAAEAPTDKDCDGVPDGNDMCPNTALGKTVDTSGKFSGCSTGQFTLTGRDDTGDDDEDGVENGTDKCPNTARGTTSFTAADASKDTRWAPYVGCAPGQVVGTGRYVAAR